MIVRCITWLRRHLHAVRLAFCCLLGLLILLDLLVPRHHVSFLGDEIPGFWALFGLLACVLIIVVSKWLGRVWLFRPEDYYEQGGGK
ncbi:MAG TPA: hypothetical protein ENI89_11090 [Desulfobulbus sp.]|nr:hypothetical protein [Desulfobulbus sp.]